MSKLLRKASMILGIIPKEDTHHSHDQQSQSISNPSDGGSLNIPTSNDNSNSILFHDAPPEVIPKNILAFRTITTLLAMIQQHQPFKLSDESQDPLDPAIHELSISTAFSTVAVTDTDVVSTVTRSSPGKLEVIACTNISHDNGQLIEQSPFPIMSRIFLLTRNFRRSNPPSGNENRDPIITETTIPPTLEPGDDGLKQYLEKRWSNPTLATHLHILSKLLVMKDPSSNEGETGLEKDCNRLLRYVVATCYPKMQRRFENRTLSQPYIDSLQKVTEFSFCEPSQKQPSSDSDQQFIELVHRTTTHNSNFVKSFPKISHQAELAHKGEAFQLYSGDTQREFHQLLLNFLQCFGQSLRDLSNSRPRLRGLAHSTATESSTEGSTTFKHHLETVAFTGYALQILSKSSAFRTHLQAISPSLTEHRRALTSMPNWGKEVEQEEHKDQDSDEELEAVQPFVVTKGAIVSLWKSYEDWLRLMVVHFDAVDILFQHFARPYLQHQTISLQILVAPPVDNALLPWRELFSTAHFPTKTGNPFITNDDIVRFLDEGISADPQALRCRVKGIQSCWNKLDKHAAVKNKYAVRMVKNEVKRLSSCKLSSWSECESKLTDLLDKWQPKDALVEANIDNMIQSMSDSTDFFEKLKNTNEQSFSGTLHCEACLASLLGSETNNTERYREILTQMKGFGRIIGVSKRCCPTCQYLLELLAEDTGCPFIIRGSHSTVTACTLPTWLPGHIVDSMNKYFGDQLRQELIDLMSRTELLRKRTQSTGSRRLSSSDSPEERRDTKLNFSQGMEVFM